MCVFDLLFGEDHKNRDNETKVEKKMKNSFLFCYNFNR